MSRRPNLSASARKSLEKRFERCRQASNFGAEMLLEMGNVADAERETWRVIEHDLTYLGASWDLCAALQASEIDAERAEILAQHLARNGGDPDYQAILPSWQSRVDRLVYRAYALFPEPFLRASKDFAASVQRGLAFVQARRCEVIAAEPAADIAIELARTFARGGPFGESIALLVDGVESEIPVVDVASLNRLAATIDPITASSPGWHEALVAAMGDNRWIDIAPVATVLREYPLRRLVDQLLARRCVAKGWGDNAFKMPEAMALFASRSDGPAELFAAASAVAATPFDASRTPSKKPLATLLAIEAARAALARGEAIPDAFEAVASFETAVEYTWLTPPLLDALRSLPRERVLTWMRASFRTTAAALVALSAHFDGAFLEAALRQGPPLWERAVGAIGAPALPLVLAAASAKGIDSTRQASIRYALVFVLDEMLRRGTPPAEEYDLELLVAAFDGRPMERAPCGDDLREATSRLLNAMPLERRQMIFREAQEAAGMSAAYMLPAIESDVELDEYLGRAIARGHVHNVVFQRLGARAVAPLIAHAASSTQMQWVHDEAKSGLSPEDFAKVADAFVPGRMWRAIEADVARALAALPDEPRVRVYLLERAGMSYSAREGSASRLGGPAIGLRKADLPTDSEGEPLEHLLTIDLADVPELSPRFPKARAIALFFPADAGDGAEDEAEVVAIPSTAPARAAKSGGPLAVRGFDVPACVFGTSPQDLGVEARAVRDRIVHAGGHVLGQAIWIHPSDEAAPDPSFVLQVADDLFEAALPFDSLYVFDRAIVAQTL